MNAGFDGGDLVALLAETQHQGGGIGVMLPGDGIFGAERGFCDPCMGWAAGDSG
jgi:hypothetical protein